MDTSTDGAVVVGVTGPGQQTAALRFAVVSVPMAWQQEEVPGEVVVGVHEGSGWGSASEPSRALVVLGRHVLRLGVRRPRLRPDEIMEP